MYDVDAVANEAEGVPFDFTFGGEKYQLPGQVDVLAAAMLRMGDFGGGLARMLGPAQWARMAASDAVMDETRLAGLLDAYKAHLGGTGVGESVASTSS